MPRWCLIFQLVLITSVLQMMAKLRSIAKDLLEQEIITPPPLSWNADVNFDEEERNFFSKAEDDDERKLSQDGRLELLAVSRMSFLISAYEVQMSTVHDFCQPFIQ